MSDEAKGHGPWTLTTTAGALTLRPTTPADLGAIVDIHRETMQWGFEHGFRTYGPYPDLRETTAARMARDAAYLATLDGAPVATVTLSARAHPLWADLPGNTLYLYALAVRRDYAGHEIGRALLDWSARKALAGGHTTLRLECDASNPRLRAYYVSAGFVERGEVDAGAKWLLRLERAPTERDRWLSDADLLAEAEAWVWMPPGTRMWGDERMHVSYPPDADHGIIHFTHAPGDAPEALVDEVLGRLRRDNRAGARWWITPLTQPASLEATLQTRGADLAERVNLLTWDLGSEPEPHLPALGDTSRIAVELVSDVDGLRRAHAVDVEVWGGPPPSDEELAQDAARLEEAERAGKRIEFQYLATVDGQAVGAAGFTLVGRVARFWGAGIVPAARHLGAYRALVAARCRDAHTRGARAVLTKAKDKTSSPTLVRAGFRTLGQERCYVLRWGEAVSEGGYE